MEEEDAFVPVALEEEVPRLVHRPHAAYPPILPLNNFEVAKLLQAAYASENPRLTLESFLEPYSVSHAQLSLLIQCVVWQTPRAAQHPLNAIDEQIQDTRRALVSMQPHTIKEQFIFYACTLSHLWMQDNGVSQRHLPVYYKVYNQKLSYVWLNPNQYGMPQVVSSSLPPISFCVSLKRRERRGEMMPLELEFFGGGQVHISMEVVEEEDGRASFAITGVEKCTSNARDFMVLLTREMRYLRSVLIQPSAGGILLYPVCIHKL